MLEVQYLLQARHSPVLVRYYCPIQGGHNACEITIYTTGCVQKTVEDARIRTTSGGVVTIASLLIILFLIWGECGMTRGRQIAPAGTRGLGAFVLDFVSIYAQKVVVQLS
jgi:hypothetical protein